MAAQDGSVDIIKDYERKYNGVPGHPYWVSEPDKDHNAMNKGIKVASGSIIILNSGLAIETLSRINILRPHIPRYSFLIYTSKGKISYPGKIDLYTAIQHIGHPSTSKKNNI